MDNINNPNQNIPHLTKRERRDLRKKERGAASGKNVRKHLYKKIVLWTVVFVGLAGSVWGIIIIAKTPRREPATIIGAITQDDQIRGEKNAKITLVEYSDFQCPACAAYHSVTKQLLQEEGGKIAFIYRHFPLPQHANAKPAAYAAEAAGKQGKFWEMHDMVFDNQKNWEKETRADNIFASYAQMLGLNLEQYKKDYDSGAVREKVERDYESGIAANVDHTPTFFLNGKELPNPDNYQEFRNAIEQAANQN